MSVYKIGTRGSELALTQTHSVIKAFSNVDITAEKQILKTRGDKDQRPFNQISGDGFFTKELERSILNRETHFAVHSAKDLPSIVHEDLPWKAFSHREETSDILIALPTAFDANGNLIDGKRIGTSSPRRELQIKNAFPNIQVESLRGNVPTRIQKVIDAHLDGVILAKAGVVRLGLLEEIKECDLVVKELDFVTAPCQGIIAVQGAQNIISTLDKIANHDLDLIAKAEKSVLALLGGGCHLPLGTKIYAEKDEYRLDFFLGGRSETIAFQLKAKTIGTLLHELVKELVNTPKPTTHRVWFSQPIQHILKPASFAAQLGIEPVAWPLLEVVPNWKEKDLQEFRAEKNRYGAVSFSSQFAVQLFMTELNSYLDIKTWLNNVRIFAIGRSTKERLAEYGITEVEMSKESHGKSLAALLEKIKIHGDILIPGQQGSLVKGRLKGFGPHSKGLTLYRMRPSRNPMSLEVPLIEKNDHIVITSPSAAKEFVLRSLKHPGLKRLSVWAFGPSTSRELGFLGVQHRTNPISGSWESVLREIKKS